MSQPQFIVVQTGARRGYAIPLILHRAGMLARFYTDVVGNSGWGRYLIKGAKILGVSRKFQLLANRILPADIIPQTTTFLIPNLILALRKIFGGRGPEFRIKNNLEWNKLLGNAACSLGYSNITHIYAMLNEFTPLLNDARRHGVKVISEIYIALSTVHIVRAEHEKFPDWEPDKAKEQQVFSTFLDENNPANNGDIFICPSKFVANDLIENWGVNAAAVHIIPYGVHNKWFEINPRPVTGRILFVGTAELRKGIHYLAMAAQDLNQRGKKYEFRIAGDVEQSVRDNPLCKNLIFLGRVPLNEIRSEYEQADIFVLPSIAEGSAEAIYEALASTLPVVTTAEAGSVVEDGKEGFIIPKGNFEAMANAIEILVEDRDIRNRFSSAARVKAKNYTWDIYGQRLIQTLDKIINKR